jgi:hypothetical protein
MPLPPDSPAPESSDEILQRYAQKSGELIEQLEWVRRELTILHTDSSMHAGVWYRKELVIIEQSIGRTLAKHNPPPSLPEESPVIL